MKRFVLSMILFFLPMIQLWAADGEFKCLLVSIEKYELAPLDYAENDISQLSTILTTRYGGSAKAVINSAADANDSGDDTAQKSIRKEIEKWTKYLIKDDTALLYLAGHGVKDKNGQLYLAMTNFNRENFETAAIPLAWIREQFGKCEAKSKLLLIDTCFAGTSKSIDFEQATTEEMSGSFAELKDIVTIASCRGDEKSWLWGDTKHSLFTYWIISAFKGHADSDNDLAITSGELFRYLQANVSWIAQDVLNKEQHPVIHNAEAGKNFKLPLRAIALSQLVDDIAEQIDLQMRVKNFKRIGIPEFTSKDGETFSPQFGTLPRWTADAVRKALAQYSRKNGGDYNIVAEKALRETLQSKGITPADLGTEKTKDLKIGGSDIPILVDGRFDTAGRSGIKLSAKLLDTNGQSEVGEANGAAMLNANELASMGVSGKFAVVESGKFVVVGNSPPRMEEQYKPEPEVGFVSAQQQQAVERVQQESNRPHPLADRNRLFDVWFEVRPIGSNRNYQRRNIVFNGNNCYLPLSVGEEYQMKIQCRTGEDIFARILVDGLNTLSQEEKFQGRGAYVEASSREEMVIAPHATLNNARAWVFNANPKATYQISGFYDVNQKISTLNRFQIVDADESVAARRNYTDQIGLITIGFFEALSGRGIGTDMDKNKENVKINLYKGGKFPGRMLAVYNIRYITPETLKTLVKK